MKLRLLILLAAALAAAPAAGQTIKSLGYNTTNGNIVAATNVSFTNSVGFATNARATTRTNLGLGGSDSVTFSNLSLSANGSLAIGGMNLTAITSGIDLAFKRAGSTELELKTNGLILHVGSYSFSGGNTNGASTTRANLGLGATNSPTFSNINIGIFGSGSSTGFAGRNSGGLFEIYGTNVSTSVPAFYGWSGSANTAFSAATARTNLELGATNAVTFSNVTASGTLAVTGDTALSGVNNTMPGATNAASGASLMTRDFVGQEFANPRNRMQTTYWFGLEGLGEWSLIGSGAIGGYGGASGGLGGGQYFYSSQTVGTNHSGAALRLGSDTTLGTTGIYRFSDGGALTMRVRMRKGDTISVPAIAFVMGHRTNTQMWQQDAYGIYFVPQPTNVWTSNGVVALNDRIAVSNVVWSVNTGGTNGATAPTWTDLIGSLVTNGSAVYRNLGPHTSNNYVLAIGSTNASQVVMTNTGKAGPVVGSRQEIVLKLRIDGTTNTPYTVYGTAENSTGESSEVSLTTTNNDSRQPQVWSRPDNLGTRTNSAVDMLIRYFSVDGILNPL